MSDGASISSIGDMAARALINAVETERRIDRWNLGYFRGQLSTIEVWMEPDRELIKQARAAVDKFGQRVAG